MKILLALFVALSGSVFAGSLDSGGLGGGLGSQGTGGLDAPHATTISGTVLQRMEKGLLVETAKKGIVLVTGYDALQGKHVSFSVLKNGTFSYTTVDGAESMIDAYKKP